MIVETWGGSATVGAAVFIYLWRQCAGLRAAEVSQRDDEIERLKARLGPIVSIEDEVKHLEGQVAERQADIDDLRSSYAAKRLIYDQLSAEIAIIDNKLSFAEMGVYEPHFEFTDPEEYKDKVRVVRERQKDMISAGTAVYCTIEWSVDGSKAKGRTMTNRNVRLTLRALNNECDAAIANTRWNNAVAMEKRIAKASEQIDKLNATNLVIINPAFLDLKIEELRLTHEYRERLKAEKEERAEQMKAAREEQRLLRDLEKAQDEEDHYQKLLAKAQAEASSIAGPKLGAFEQQIAMLQEDLAEATKKRERAQAMAEQTRSGYVYIISNIGSFGEGVVKIGLTRRLDPMDRVRELGDASVPFIFDTHAIIYSDDAPALERALHGRFDPVRVNMQNYRKEFFRAALEDVEAAVTQLAPQATFFRDIEAQEYMETLSRRNAALAAMQPKEELFPVSV